MKYFTVLLFVVMTLVPRTSHALGWMTWVSWLSGGGWGIGNCYDCDKWGMPCCAMAYTDPNTGGNVYNPSPALLFHDSSSGACNSSNTFAKCITFEFPQGESPTNMSRSTRANLIKKLSAAGMSTDISSAKAADKLMIQLYNSKTLKKVSLQGLQLRNK